MVEKIKKWIKGEYFNRYGKNGVRPVKPTGALPNRRMKEDIDEIRSGGDTSRENIGWWNKVFR